MRNQIVINKIITNSTYGYTFWYGDEDGWHDRFLSISNTVITFQKISDLFSFCLKNPDSNISKFGVFLEHKKTIENFLKLGKKFSRSDFDTFFTLDFRLLDAKFSDGDWLKWDKKNRYDILNSLNLVLDFFELDYIRKIPNGRVFLDYLNELTVEDLSTVINIPEKRKIKIVHVYKRLRSEILGRILIVKNFI